MSPASAGWRFRGRRRKRASGIQRGAPSPGTRQGCLPWHAPGWEGARGRGRPTPALPDRQDGAAVGRPTHHPLVNEGVMGRDGRRGSHAGDAPGKPAKDERDPGTNPAGGMCQACARAGGAAAPRKPASMRLSGTRRRPRLGRRKASVSPPSRHRLGTGTGARGASVRERIRRAYPPLR